MGVDVTWLNNEDQIVLWTIAGSWQWAEVTSTLKTALALQTSVASRVDAIIDLRESQSVPRFFLLRLQEMANQQPDNLYLSVFVTQDGLFEALVKGAGRINPIIAACYKVVPDIDSAYQHILRDRQPDGLVRHG